MNKKTDNLGLLAPREAHADNGHCKITVKCNLGEAAAVTFGLRSRSPEASYAGGTSTAKSRRATLSDLPKLIIHTT
jgi:hypothetical protein